MSANPIYLAIDTPNLEAAQSLIGKAGPHVGGIKFGLEYFCALGHDGVRRAASGLPVFLDLKLHDIPNTVAGAVRAVAPLQPAILNVHAAGGGAMMRAAREAAADAAGDGPRMRIIAVTVLTSLDDADLDAIGQRGPAGDQVKRLAGLAQASGLDGVVCGPLEVAALRAQCGSDFLLVVPGIRPVGASLDDQKRVMGPAEAIAAGADHLVIGRPINAAPDPAAAARAIAEQLAR
ncbi:MAG TPA: orotidine-5'-phosphate decarboxylase [Aliidongia sp.]|nr:orotidine-5'-phosphate decarboxylase [Aliidongia sp.]